MPCDTVRRRRQTVQQRAAEVRKVVEKIDAKIQAKTVKVKVGPQGAIAFQGLTAEERDDVTDSCIYRRIMATGSATAKLAIAQAEMLAGTKVSQQALAAGWHAHGDEWHHGH
jgi:hypothetical protein